MPGLAVEALSPGAFKRNRIGDTCIAFSDRNFEVEQDRASLVLLYIEELAGATIDRYRNSSQSDRIDYHGEGINS